MKLRVLGASGGEGIGRRPSAFLVDDRMLVDAGTVTGVLGIAAQRAIEHVLLSHSHLDHLAGLAFLTESLAFGDARDPLIVASIEPVVEAVRSAVFNDVLWPDFSRIPNATTPVMSYRTLLEGVEQRVGDWWVIPVAVNHTVPAAGFVVRDGSRGFVYSGDTGPTEALWKIARDLPAIRAVILECAFPNRFTALARAARHMTPHLIRRELDKLPAGVPVWIFHVKPQFHEETAEELSRLDGPVTLLEQDRTYVL
jgi:ribonuclease BN (tRNA processing enzyme)